MIGAGIFGEEGSTDPIELTREDVDAENDTIECSLDTTDFEALVDVDVPTSVEGDIRVGDIGADLDVRVFFTTESWTKVLEGKFSNKVSRF